MPRRKVAPGVHPRIKDASEYEREIRRLILDPYIGRFESAIRNAGDNYVAIREAILSIGQFPPTDPAYTETATTQMSRLRQYHIKRFRKIMRRFLGVKIDFMRDADVGPLMEQAIHENVNLIKTIPERYHESLKVRMVELNTDAPFDQQVVSNMLSDEYKSSGYNLRRLTRDQTSKTIGKLSEFRQKQVGIVSYVWEDSGDGRVRQTHRDNNGKTYRWDSPPPVTGPPGQDVQCRCTARPVIPEEPSVP